MCWRVEVLNDTVRAEIRALPPDMQARFVRIGERISQAGLESLREPHIKHVEGKLWEIRLIGREWDCPCTLRHCNPKTGGCGSSVHQENPKDPAQRN